jgi:hypothetical protein
LNIGELDNRDRIIPKGSGLSRRKPEAVKHLKYNLMLIYSISPVERGEEPPDLPPVGGGMKEEDRLEFLFDLSSLREAAKSLV